MKIGRILYRDPYFLLQDDYLTSELLPHEAYGYITESEKDYIVRFILNERNDCVIKGIVVPKGALDSRVRDSNNEAFQEYRLKRIRVLWRDVVFIANTQRTDSSIFQTEGTLVDIHCQSLVIRAPKTKRIFPVSEEMYPSETQPTFFIIPISLVEKINV